MINLDKFSKFNETRGVADATLYLVDIICDTVLDETYSFLERYPEDIITDIVERKLDYEELVPILPKKSVYAWFPVSKLVLHIELKREKESAGYPFLVGGWASEFGKKKHGSSWFRKGVKKNPDHSISLNMGIEVVVGDLDLENSFHMNSFLIKLESVVLHELNHLYEYYHRTWDPYGRNIQTSITWASIGEKPEGINESVFKYWQDNFLMYIYQSEPHEINAQVQEAKSYVDRLSYQEFKNTLIWKNIKKMQNFDENSFLDSFHEEVLREDPSAIESDILIKLIKSWKKEYKKLYKGQTEQNKPRPEFFDKMSDAQFMAFWGKKIRESGERMLRRILRLYSDK